MVVGEQLGQRVAVAQLQGFELALEQAVAVHV
jgi:hypothetical protein